ncbi:hypothetical protein FAIPA1_230060 [Frankia sp. AiPs1]
MPSPPAQRHRYRAVLGVGDGEVGAAVPVRIARLHRDRAMPGGVVGRRREQRVRPVVPGTALTADTATLTTARNWPTVRRRAGGLGQVLEEAGDHRGLERMEEPGPLISLDQLLLPRLQAGPGDALPLGVLHFEGAESGQQGLSLSLAAGRLGPAPDVEVAPALTWSRCRPC